MTGAPLGVAVIGYEFMGKAHSHAWRNVGAIFDVPAFERRVLVGRNEEQVAAAAARLGWQEHSTDWRAVIDRDDIDIVDICAPGALHAEIAVAALAAGKHVLVEKPLSNTIDEGEAMVAAASAAAERGIRSMVGFNYRRVPALALARQLIADGRLGEVRQVRACYLQDWLADADAPMSWRLRAETAGSGALGDIASHAIDQIHFLLGDEVSVSDVSGRLHTFVGTRPGPSGDEPVTVDDAAWATLGLAGGPVGAGAIASVEASRVALGAKNALRIEVYGSRGSLTFDLERLNELNLFDGDDSAETRGYRRILVTEAEHPYVGSWWPAGHVLGWEHSHTHQIRDFLVAIAEGTAPSPSFADGLTVQRVLAAVEQSAADRGARVAITAPATI